MKTAVEWLKEQYDSCPHYEPFLGESEWEQAKEMEKEFMIKHSVELCKILISNPFETSGKTPQELVDAYFSITFKSE